MTKHRIDSTPRTGLRARTLATLLAGVAVAACASASAPAPSEAPGSSAEAIVKPAVLRLRPAGLPGDGDLGEAGCSPSTSNMTNAGKNPVMHNVRAHLIYWLPSGTHFVVGGDATSDAVYEGALQRFITDIGSTPLFQMLSQYTDATGKGPASVTLAGTTTVSTAYPGGKGTTASPLVDSDYRDVINGLLDAKSGGWTASTDDIFFVFTGASVESCSDSGQSLCTFNAKLSDGTTGQAYGAYHSVYGHGGANVVYANMPSAASIGYFTGQSAYPNDAKIDPTIMATSHELFEAMTDPLINAWKGPAGNCDEIGDKCNVDVGPASNFDGSNLVMPNGDRWVVQREWSNAASACSMGVAPPPAPGCTATATCDDEWFQYKPAPGYHTKETVHVTCANAPTVVQEYAAGWSDLPLFKPNDGYPTTTPNVYVVGEQLEGKTTQGDAIGTSHSIRACTVTSAGTTCDATAGVVTIPDCCQPISCEGACGKIDNGCGQIVQCGGCADGETCNPNGVCVGPVTCHSAMQCCAQAGGSWVHGRCE